MKMKSMVLFAVALGFGTIAMLGVQKALSKDGPKKEDTVKVLMATSDIAPGVPLDATNTAFKAWPKSSLPEGVVTKTEEYENRSLMVRTFSGEIILLAKLGEPGFHSLTGDIPEGMRVVTVPVDATKTHSGLMMPGNSVDVLVTYKARDKKNTIVSKTRAVLEHIKVFATDNRRDMKGSDVQESNAAKNVSLLVTPDQANLLMLAENKGKLHLALRRDDDDTPANAVSVDESVFEDAAVGFGEDGNSDDAEGGDTRQFLDKAQAKKEPEVEKAPEKPRWKMTIYSGKDPKVEEVELPVLPEAPLAPPPARSGSPSADAGSSGAKGVFKGLVIRFFAGV
jgi:pilus assembly protein CpaB